MSLQEQNSRELLSTSSTLGFSETRGNLHTFGIENEDDPAIVLANGGAQLMNSPHYANRFNSQLSYGLIKSNEMAMTPYMMAFTRPQDTLVFSTENAELSVNILDQVHHYYQQIGIETTTQYEPMHDVDNMPFQKNIVPHILSPEILAHFGMQETAERNVEAYKKNVTETIWRENGVPVPPTAYIRAETSPEEVANIIDNFKHYNDLVVNITDGSGGFGLTFIDINEAVDFISNSQRGFVNGELLQVQGKLPLVSSPCVILNIGEDSIHILTTSEQRFSEPGVHGGNIWTKDFAKQLAETYPEFDETIMNAATTLQKYGVRGQINMDALITSKENSAKYQVPEVSMREANIRPAGSSVLLRMQNDGVINDKKVAHIMTNTFTHVDQGLFLRRQVIDTINNHPDMKTVMYNYSPNGKTGIAFLGNENVTLDELKQYEKDTLYSLHSWR